MSTAPVRLEAAKLTVSYTNTVALRSLEFDVTGRVIALIGHNGAGKSTLIKTALGLLTPSTGSLSAVDAGSGALLTPVDHMAFCPETGAVFADIPVESYLALWCRLKHGDPRYFRGPGRRFIEILSLEPLLKRFGRELSKGQRRRVQTAIGFLTTPRLFLFDEPFDGLDVQRTSELSELIMRESGGMSFVVSSHRMDVVEQIADAVIVLRDGEIAAAGPVDEVVRALAGQSTIISHAARVDELMAELASRFPASLITRIASQVTITGFDTPLAELTAVVRAHGIGEHGIETTRPRLVDAMNFHLRSIQGGPGPGTPPG